MSQFAPPFLVEIRDSPNHKVLELEARTFTDAKIIADRYLRDRTNIVVIRKVKGLLHDKPFRWIRNRHKEWTPTANFNQYEAGEKTPKFQSKDAPCLWS